jgi:dCTP diphosphatase
MSTKPTPDYAKLNELMVRIRAFNEARDWAQFHNPKDLAISLALEAAEVLEHFQWKSPEEMRRHLSDNNEQVADELADVLYWVLLMSDYFKIDMVEAMDRKMTQNEAKYPAEKARGRHAKYTELG